jgi:hypothetical protein
LNNSWASRRWFDFRLGHSTYLIFALSFGNFVLIFHRLFIERVPALNEIFSSLWIFAFVFILAYIPVAVVIGSWHRKTQLKVDQEQSIRQNRIWVKVFRIIIDIQTGKATDEEIEKIQSFLKSIEKDQNK